MARYRHTATMLTCGKVLLAGGIGAAGTLASTELYDPATGTWSMAESLSAARYRHSSTLLASGKVLVACGIGAAGTLASTELFDPVTGTWSAVENLAASRYGHTATLLPDGKVLATGGGAVRRASVWPAPNCTMCPPGAGA